MNVLIYRLPRDISIIYPSSYCPNCGSKIKLYNNIPLVSYILLKGRCSCCNSRISIRYPLVEFSYALVVLVFAINFGVGYSFIYYSIFAFFLLAASYSDLFTLMDKNFTTGVIPNSINYTGICLGVVLSILPNIVNIQQFGLDINFKQSIIGAVSGYIFLYIPNLVYKLLKGYDGIGGGDMKLLAVVGSFMGIKFVLFVLFISSLIGSIVGIIIVLITRNKNFPIPFGPFIAISALLLIFLKDYISNIYNMGFVK